MTNARPHHADRVLDAVKSPSSAALSPVAASWCRSALRHGLDPAGSCQRELIETAALQDLREAHAPLLSVAAPILDQMYRTIGRAGCGLVLSDRHGTILESRIGDSDVPEFSAAGLVVGARWGEAEEGTNGIGTCLFDGQAVIIHRDQHFSSRNIGLSCMDAPVYDPYGRLVAALDASSCRRDHSPVMAGMIATMVRGAAHRIERDFFLQHFGGARIMFLGDDDAHGAALLATDRDDLVIGASRAARLRLGVDDETLAHPRPMAHVLGQDDAPSFEQGDRAALRQAMAQAGGNASAAARLLGIGRATLYRRLARAGLRDRS